MKYALKRKLPRASKALTPDPVREAISQEVVRRLKEDKTKEWGFNAVFSDVAHSHGVFHGADRKRYNSYFGAAERAANAALGRPFVQCALEREHARPTQVSPQDAGRLMRRILGEGQEDEAHP